MLVVLLLITATVKPRVACQMKMQANSHPWPLQIDVDANNYIECSADHDEGAEEAKTFASLLMMAAHMCH